MTPELRYGPDWLHDKIAAGELVVIDGAMGTELETRGVPMNEKVWSGVAMLSHPEVVRAAHVDYIAAGAEVIITNTFGAGPQVLESAGFGDQMESITRRAVEVARQARDEAAKGPVAIAGSMCPWVDPKESLDVVHLSEGFRKHAELLAEEGVDLIALEMCSRLDYAALITEAAVATGLPVWLGMSCARHEGTGDLVGFDQPNVDFAESVSELASIGVGVINIMHTSIADTAAGLELVKEHWSGPIGAYPESGHFVMPNWQFVDIIEPDDLVQEMRVWVANGVQIIGGCCGLGLPHIRALKAAFA